MKGEIVMTLELEKMLHSLLNNTVPSSWKKLAYESIKPLGSWFDDLICRITFFKEWGTIGLPKSYLLSAFFFPQGFLTSVL